ncbi:MAG: efflux RND transporter periplasmic adaptor subunit [Flavobacteriales bacterium]|nr:efflux RND transporter periplasmic adaptor subunit [Flavobacteriales bacterium]
MKIIINHYKGSSYNLLFMVMIMNLAIFTGCSNLQEESVQNMETKHQEEETVVELSEAQYKVAEIELGKIERRTLSNALRVNGIIDAPPQNLVSISAPLGGFVVSTELLQGMKIKKGQILVTMEHPDYVQLQQDYLDKKSKLEYLEQEFKRQEELYKGNVNSGKIFQQAKSDYISMKIQVKGLQEKLAILGIDASKLSEDNLSRKVKIYSPINGYVSAVNVNIGKYANPTDVMFEIVNTKHLHAELTVYEKDVVKLKIGQKVRFTLPNDNGKERVATVYLIGRKIDADRSVRVHAHLENEDTDLLPGMYITASIELNENKVNAVQQQAIVLSGGKYFVYVFLGEQIEKDKKVYHFEMTEVKKGVTDNGYSEIYFVDSVIADSIQLVTAGSFSLLAKMMNTEGDGEGHGH